MPRPTMTTTRYELPLGAKILISVWSNGEQQIEADVAGTCVACGYVAKTQTLADARPVVYSPEVTNPRNLAAFAEALAVIARYIETGKIDRGYLAA